MANNVYRGRRYVPKIMGTWDNTKQTAYEPLSIVEWGECSYTSKIDVPVGIDITNTKYWVCTGNYNAQVELYRRETNDYRIEVEGVVNSLGQKQDKEDNTLLTTVKSIVGSINEIYTDIKNNVKNEIESIKNSIKTITTNIENIAYTIYPSGGNDSILIQDVINKGYKNIRLVGNKIKIDTPVILKSNIKLSCNTGTYIENNTDVMFLLEESTSDVYLENIKAINISDINTYAIKCMGGDDTSTIATSVRRFIVRNCVFEGFETGFKFRRIRQSLLDNVTLYCKNAIEYSHKSAELNITNSFFVHDGEEHTGSFGIKCYAEDTFYPEGLMITNTLIFRYESNLLISDLYVGNFTNVHFDSYPSYCRGNELNYNVKTEFLNFNSCWFYSKGFIFGEVDKYTTPKLFKSKINNCFFDNMKDGNSILINRFVHSIDLVNLTFYSNGSSNEHVGIACVGNNNRIFIDDLNFSLYSKYIVFNGTGENNTVKNVPNNDNLQEYMYSAYPVTCDNEFGVGGFGTSKIEIPRQQYIGRTDIVTLTRAFGVGSYDISAVLNELTVTTKGFFEIFIPTSVNFKLSNGFTDTSYLVSHDTTDKTKLMNAKLVVKKASNITVKLLIESGTASIGYNSNFSITKM